MPSLVDVNRNGDFPRKSLETDVGSQGIGETDPRSEVRDQRAGVRSQGSEVRGQKLGRSESEKVGKAEDDKGLSTRKGDHRASEPRTLNIALFYLD